MVVTLIFLFSDGVLAVEDDGLAEALFARMRILSIVCFKDACSPSFLYLLKEVGLSYRCESLFV